MEASVRFQGKDGTFKQGTEARVAPLYEQRLTSCVRDRRKREFQKAYHHSNIVSWLKIALPVIAGFVLLGIFLTSAFRLFLEKNQPFDRISIVDGKLVMENPHLDGEDGRGRPYTIRADKAVQDTSDPEKVSLESIIALLPFEENSSMRIKAGNGVYDANARHLSLGGDIRVKTDEGLYIMLQDADIDLKKGTLLTLKPVFAVSPKIEISALNLMVEDEGSTIVFEGEVSLTLYGSNQIQDTRRKSGESVRADGRI